MLFNVYLSLTEASDNILNRIWQILTPNNRYPVENAYLVMP